MLNWKLQGTTQNDIEGISIKRYIHISTKAIYKDDFRYDNILPQNIPKWNPTNICSYHLQEAGATRSRVGLYFQMLFVY